jgi:hypothetical protein
MDMAGRWGEWGVPVRPMLLAVLGLVAMLSVACNDGDSQTSPAAGTAALSSTSAQSSPTAELPCEPPRDITSYRYTWRFKLEVPGGEDTAANLEATARAGPRKAQLEDPLEEVAMVLTASMTGGAADIQLDVAGVAPDRHEARISLGDLRYTLIEVGQRAWLRVGEEGWQESPTLAEGAPLTGLPEMCKGFDALFPDLPGPFGPLFPDLPGLFPGRLDETPEAVVTPELPDVGDVETQEETISGIETVHYHAELTDIAEIAGYLGMPVDDPEALEELGSARYDMAEMVFDWWLAKEGNWPVRMEFAFKSKADEGGDASEYALLEVKDLNDPSIKIEPPAEND